MKCRGMKRLRAEEEEEEEEATLVRTQGNNIYFYADVTPATVLELQLALDRLGSTLPCTGTDHVNLYVQSGGGCCWAGFGAYDVVRNARLTVNTIAVGRACSAATFFWLAGSNRYVGRSAEVLIHQPSALFCGKTAVLRDEMQNTEAVTARMVAMYVQHSTMSSEQVRTMLSDEKALSAEEALRLGLADEIW
jgi:ATP-dependent Clp endopeptidase proteolytic subunit ClpP